MGKLIILALIGLKYSSTSKESDDFDLKKNEVLKKLNHFNITCSGNPRKYVDNTIGLFEELLDKSLTNLDKKNIT